MASGFRHMFVLLSKCGGIKDVGLGLSWDPATLRNEVNRRAAELARLGIGRGSVVAIAHSGTARFFADLFATWSVGAAAACLDSTLTSGELQNVVSFANSSMVLVDGAKSLEKLSVPAIELEGASPRGGSTVTQPLNADDPALLLFTSGTTGTPKGVVLKFGALLDRIDANITAIGTGALARTLVSLPTYFGHGLIGNSLTPLTAGGTIVLHPLGMPLINNLGSIIDEHSISFMSSVPSLWRLALTCGPKPTGSSLVRVHVGSAPLSAALWSEICAWSSAEVVNCYGITETANWIGGASSKDDIADGLVGTMWGGSAGVMDENGTIRGEGTGEIVIKSSCLMSGYYNRPDLTAAAFHQGHFRTGDQGLIDEKGRIWVTGRIKDEINRGGFKVQPAEIDALLEGHPAVAEACVFGVPDPMGGEAVAAAIRLAKGEDVSSLSLQSWCSQRLRRAAVPEHWFFVNEIPRNARGKVSRDNVRRLLTQDSNAHALKSEPEKPKSATIAIASTFIADPIVPALRFALGESGLKYEVRAAAYNQLFQELLSSTGLLATNMTGINVIVMRFEDFVREVDNIEEARGIITQTASKLQNALSDHAQRAKVPTLLAVLPTCCVPKALLPDVDAATEALLSHATSLRGISFLSPSDIDRVSSQDRYDKVGDEFAHMPFTEEHYSSIALAIARKVHALHEPADETLWNGALSNGRNLLQALHDRGARSRTLPGSPTMPATDTERVLLDLWQAILGVEGIGVEDDYFALGGTSLMAARLFTEISRHFDTKMPLSAILESPTVRALSRHVGRQNALPGGQLIHLRPGGVRKLFFVHDGKGETLLYLNLARKMPSDLDVIGIGPRRVPGVPVAHARIEDMAAFYLEQVRKKQPHGPYLFAGMCAGGVIAYEMAAQLVGDGEVVDLVALLDANTPQAPKRAGRIAKQRMGRLTQVLKESKGELTPTERATAVAQAAGQKFLNTLFWEIRKHSLNLSVHTRFILLRELLSRNAAWPDFVPKLTAHQILNSAQARYVPKPLSISSIVLARANSGEGIDTPYSSIYADETLGWDAVAENLTVVDVDGGHSSMLQETFVDSLAKALTPYVRQKPMQANPRVIEAVET